MSELTMMEMEAAINFWRARSPSSGDELRLCAEAAALCRLYARMIIERRSGWDLAELDAPGYAAWQTWYASHETG